MAHLDSLDNQNVTEETANIQSSHISGQVFVKHQSGNEPKSLSYTAKMMARTTPNYTEGYNLNQEEMLNKHFPQGHPLLLKFFLDNTSSYFPLHVQLFGAGSLWRF